MGANGLSASWLTACYNLCQITSWGSITNPHTTLYAFDFHKILDQHKSCCCSLEKAVSP